ncbi:sensor histidine kinase [Mangrovibacterium diazotrophicum]|uniref:histidine kinase n=1 Tax=Mangrovibacterium diazotrophicum TaxID=1261403 RepID=A0A419W4L7_9BACT|nr:PAS domain S-box protein [Mangrovibacterium diazotrophicum]RKD90411.1 PAS domain S-box-containing protein [Mangrovibacterium diazotrophicum]
MNIPSHYLNKSKEDLLTELESLLNEKEQALKELKIIHQISALIENPEYSFNEIISQAITIIHDNWLLSRLQSVKVIIGDQEYTSPNFEVTPWKLTEVISAEYNEIGDLQLFCSEEPSLIGTDTLQHSKELLHLIAVKLGEAAAKNSLQKKFNITFHQSPVAVCILDIDAGFQFLDANETLIEESGYKREELINKKLSDLGILKNPDVIDDLKESFHSKELIQGYPIQINSIENEIKYLIMNARKLSINSQNIAVASFIDITEILSLKASEKASNEFNRLLIDSIPLGLEIVNQDGKILFANKVLKNMFGEDLVGKTCWYSYRNNSQPCDTCPVKKTIQIGETFSSETNELIGNRTLQVNHTGFRYKGKPALLKIFIDITERRKTEQELRDANEKLHVIFDNVDDAYLQTDNNATITYVNPAAPAMFGYSSVQEMMGLQADLLYGKPSDALDVRNIMAQGEHIHDETYLAKRKDGSVFWVSMNARYIYDENGNIKGRQGFIRDISQRQEFEQQLIEAKETAERNEQKLREAQELAKIGSWDWDKQTNTINWSPELYHLLKLNPNLPPPGIYQSESIYTPDSLEKLSAAFQECLATEKPYAITLEMVKADGKHFFVKTQGRIVKSETGEVIGLQGTVQDIDRRRRLEIELTKAKNKAEANEKKLEEAQDIARIGSWEWSLTTNTTQWSPALFHLLGMEPNSSLPTYDESFAFISPESRTKVEKAVSECLQNGEPFILEFEMIRADGSFLTMLSRGRPTFDATGVVIGLQGTVQDITAQKALESDLIRAKDIAEANAKELNEAQKLAGIGSWQWIAGTDTVTWSESFFTLVGLDPSLPAPSYAELPKFHTEESFSRLNVVVEHSMKTGEPFELELEMIKKDRSTTLVWSKGNALRDENGRIIGLYGTVLDINAQKKLEADLIKAKEKAEESNRLKTAFLLNMSHEIRTPMNGILGFMGLLDEPDLDAETRSEFISIINQSGERLMTTINDLLEISKIEIGDLNLHFAEVDLREVMKFKYDFFKIQTANKGIHLKLGQQITGESAQIISDRNKLGGIMINLIRNAFKFTDNGEIEFGNYLKDDKLWFYVTDTGIGIPQDKIDVIFDRFVQADLGLSREYEGSGIGLSIAKAYVEALGGEIEVKSEVDKGSTFSFWIPYSPVSKPL